MGATWLEDAIVYEIYPQSFADSDGDGIGDLRGVIDRLDYLEWLGITAIWFNPCFDSPFRDAGYDVRDYLRIAPRYGSNEDLEELVDKARARGIRVVLDLVAGHTSIDHPWFQGELHADGPDPAGDRYVWCDDPPLPNGAGHVPGTAAWVPSPGPRPGYYLKNFYDEQPALNFGWARLTEDEPWRQPVDAPGPRRNRDELCQIMAFWLDKGVSGFRVDMAFSLVKDDEGHRETVALWREVHAWLDRAYPDAVLIPEGIEPRTGAPLAFDADFFLVIFPEHASLFDNGAAGRLPWTDHSPCYFDADGRGSARPFIEAYEHARAEDHDRLVLMATADHDFDRLATGSRTADQLGAAYAFLLTWGTVPSIYYGDEIGMRYLPGAPDVEGAVCHPDYNRAGCRTPMQWDDSANAGFSSAAATRLYLPIDPDPSRPTVAAVMADETSIIHAVRRLVALRRRTPALGPRASTEVLSVGYPLAYVRGGTHLVVVNPRRAEASLALGRFADGAQRGTILEGSGVNVADGSAHLAGFGYAVIALSDVSA